MAVAFFYASMLCLTGRYVLQKPGYAEKLSKWGKVFGFFPGHPACPLLQFSICSMVFM